MNIAKSALLILNWDSNYYRLYLAAAVTFAPSSLG
jgi:hypothetical protein